MRFGEETFYDRARKAEEEIEACEVEKQRLKIGGFRDGTNYSIALMNMKDCIELLRLNYNKRENHDLKTLELSLESSRLCLGTFNSIDERISKKYPIDFIKEIYLCHNLNQGKEGLITLFENVYKALNNYVKSKKAVSSA